MLPLSLNSRNLNKQSHRDIKSRPRPAFFYLSDIEAYEGKCAVTGCTISALLEAAHIIPYAGAWHTKAQHGLLLKTDINTLFDKGLLWFDDELRVCLAPVLLVSEYAVYLGNNLALPELKEHWPLQDHLTRHRLFFSKAGNVE